MATRDFTLILRARDAASKALKTVGGAMNELQMAQVAFARDARGVSSAFDQIQKASARSGAQTKATATAMQAAYSKIGTALDQARASYRAQEGDIERLRDAQRALAAQTQSAQAALASQRAGLQNARAVRDYADAQREAGDMGNRLVRNFSALEQEVTGYETRIKGAEAALKGLGGEMRASTREITAAETALSRSGAELRDIQNKANAAHSALNGLRRVDYGPTIAETRALRDAIRGVDSAGRPLIGTLRRVATELSRTGTAADRTGTAFRRTEGSVIGARRAFSAFYGDSRRAMSTMQRIRGEIIALGVAFVGIQGTIAQAGQVYQAFTTNQAAEVRLGAIFDDGEVGAEMAFLRTEARRLGVEFGTLSTNYSTFQISAQKANLTAEETRDIFVKTTEASRVLKLSNEQITGVLNAMTQIAGKGTVQMEELRQQLGDRLPGAVSIMAQGLGYGADQLSDFYKAVEDGEVSARDGLTALANELNKTFGSQLEAALDQTATKVGRLQNLLFERRLSVAEGGMIDGLNVLVDAINEFLASEDGIAMFRSLGAAVGKLLAMLPQLAEHMDGVGLVFKALIALKVVQFIRGVVGSFGGMTVASVGARRSFIAMNAAMAVMVPGLGNVAAKARAGAVGFRVLAGGMMVATRAVTGLWAAFGGLPGILLSGAIFVATGSIASAAGEVDTLTDALLDQRDIMDDVSAKYREAAGDVDVFRDSLADLSAVQIRENMRQIREGIAEAGEAARDALANSISSGARGERSDSFQELLRAADSPESVDAARAYGVQTQAFLNGADNADELRAAIEALESAFGDDLPDAVLKNVAALDKFLQTSARGNAEIEESQQVLDAQAGSSEAAAELADQLGGAMSDLGNDMAAASGQTEGFTGALGTLDAAMQKLGANIPAFKEMQEGFAARAKIAEAYQEAMAAANALPSGEREASLAAARERRDLALEQLTIEEQRQRNQRAENQDLTGSFLARRGTSQGAADTDLVGLVREMAAVNNWSAEEILTLISYETAGTFSPDIMGGAGGNYRGLIQWSPENQQRYGINDSTTMPQQVAAIEQYLKDRGVQRGDGGLPMYAAINAGQAHLTGASDAHNGGRPGTVQWKYENDMGGHRAKARGLLSANPEAANDQGVFNDELARTNEQRAFELELQDKGIADAAVAIALREAEQEAQAQGLALTQAQRAEIEQTTRALHSSADAEERRSAAIEEAQQAEAEVSRLMDRRRFLMEQLEYFDDEGDQAGYAQTEEELERVNAALLEAQENAAGFWRAVGGQEAEAALQTLDQSRTKIAQVDAQQNQTAGRTEQLVATKMGGAWSTFAQAVANGENAMDALATATQQAVAEILIEVGKAIVQRMLLNAITGGSGGGGGGILSSLFGAANGAMGAGVRHSGGMAGGPGPVRMVSPTMFANAQRYHTGGMAGLAPNEVPIIAERNEEILAETDPRHRNNAGSGGEGMSIINAIDGPGLMKHALGGATGRKTMLNFVRANRETIKAALG